MYIQRVFWIILLLFSCKEPPVLPLEGELSVDIVPPIIKWISPRFDAVVNEMVAVQCKVTYKSGIANVEIWVDDSLQSDIKSILMSDSIYTLNWPIMNYNNGDTPLLFIKALDNEGNDTVSPIIRVIIDDNHAYPEPVVLYPLDSLIIDSVFSGYTLRWWYSGDQYFYKYILQKSFVPLMTNSIEIFSTENKSTIKHDEYDIDESLLYYQMTIEDIFGKQTAGNVVSNTMMDMPPHWDIQSVQYTASTLSISWDNPTYNHYSLHKLLYSDRRDGIFNVLEEYDDSSNYQYEGEFSPSSENWFSIQTEDSLGQISMSQPYMHPPPHVPIIDSVLYDGNSFRLQWSIEPDIDFANYHILFSEEGDAFALSEIIQINNQAEDTIHHSINESEYYLYQIITTDVWGLETRGPLITASSFYKFSTTEDNDGSSDVLHSVTATIEGKYIAVGRSNQFGGWLLKVDELGEIEDESENFGEANSVLHSIVNAPDGSLLITGSIIVNQFDDLLVKKVNIDGSIDWSNNYGSDYPDEGNAIINLSDGDIGVIGYSYINTVNQDIFVLKIDADDGSEIWSTKIGGNEADIGHDILPSEGGGMYILGETYSQGDAYGDIWIIELNSEGYPIDTVLIEYNGKQVGYSFAKSELGGFTIAGITSGSSGVTDALMIQVNKIGEIEWIFTYGGIYNDLGYSLVYSDGGWVLVGQTYSYDKGGGDAWILKVSEVGDFEWMRTYGGTNNDSAFDIAITSDGGFIICGSTYIPSNQSDGWLLKTDSQGNYKEILPYP